MNLLSSCYMAPNGKELLLSTSSYLDSSISSITRSDKLPVLQSFRCYNILVFTCYKYSDRKSRAPCSSVPALPSRIKRIFYMSSQGRNLLHKQVTPLFENPHIKFTDNFMRGHASHLLGRNSLA
ncbi:hypothetical protein MKX03_033141 [Papaver bracteatum]|nr:hypothetical protein MKX03_033141 [Papaver bracteatum]